MNLLKVAIFSILLHVLSVPVFSQHYQSTVLFQGNKLLALSASNNGQLGKGVLSTGEIILSGCDHGACYFKIIYKSKIIAESIGENFDNLKVYEYDFSGDGDKELVVQVDQKKIGRNGSYSGETTNLYVYQYAKGMLQKIFEKEIMMYKTIIKKDYIEFYMPSGLDTIWNYYLGNFYQMVPFRFPTKPVR